ncbi:hypothetical protein [Streptomyces longwoodensis]|uniref:hypothetical protein n=1 Tax=Streptomyces longwoodensis TaxID=68231 RepID=UPI0038500F7A
MRYDIRVDGQMSQTMAEVDYVIISGQTLLYGPVIDDAHLYGLLVRFQSLRLRMVEMRQLPD